MIPMLPLKVQQDREPVNSWNNFATPQDFLIWAARSLAVDPNQLSILNEVYVGTTEPVGEERGKTWFKTNPPYAIYLFNGTEYEPVYNYPPNVPLLWTKDATEFPSYLHRLTESELTQYGLTNPEDAFYFMLRP